MVFPPFGVVSILKALTIYSLSFSPLLLPQASVDDNDSIGKNSLYHEPFNVNMYTSGVNGYAAVNDLQCNMTPDYTGV